MLCSQVVFRHVVLVRNIPLQIDYEARDAMESESVPAFFIDRERLCHLHPEWAESAYRADKDVKDPSELEDDLIIDAKTAIRLAYSLDESGDDEDDEQTVMPSEVKEGVVFSRMFIVTGHWSANNYVKVRWCDEGKVAKICTSIISECRLS